MGLMKGYTANNDFKNALKYAKAAQPRAPDKASKDAVDGSIKSLKGKRYKPVDWPHRSNLIECS